MRQIAPFSKIEPAGRRGQWRRGFLLAAVAVLALAASLVSAPAPAEAQSSMTLVSNLGKSRFGAYTVGPSAGIDQRYATSFTTGNSAYGYGLTSVALSVGHSSGTRIPEIKIHAHGDHDRPGSELFTLTNPANIHSAVDTFLAPPGTRLKPNTTYWVAAYASGGEINVDRTRDSNEDSGYQPDWSIGNRGQSKPANSGAWTNHNHKMKMAVQGTILPPRLTFVSNIGLGDTTSGTVGPVPPLDYGRAARFTTGNNSSDFSLDSVTLALGLRAAGANPVPEINMHADSNGLPGAKLFTLTNPPDFANTISTTFSNFITTARNFTFLAPPGTRLQPNTPYWVAAYAAGGEMVWMRTPSDDERAESQAGWSISKTHLSHQDRNEPFSGWVLDTDNAHWMAVHGAPFTRNVEGGVDLAITNDTLGFVDTSAPSSGTLNDPLDDLRSNGDRWRLRVDSSRRYRVEVNFGSATPQDGYDEGGGIDVWDFKPRGDLWDHRSDDGRAFIEFHTSPRTPYYLLVRARSFGEHQTWEYFGPYTITLTDISHIYQMVSNGADAIPIIDVNGTVRIPHATRRIGELPEFEGSVETIERATSFTTGPLSAGYRLEYITVGLWRGSGVPSVKVALYTDNSGDPGTKLFDFERISGITNAYSALIGDRFWVPASAAHLTAGTTYWVVFENETPGTYYRVRRTRTAKNNAGAASGWSIGGKISSRDTNIELQLGAH